MHKYTLKLRQAEIRLLKLHLKDSKNKTRNNKQIIKDKKDILYVIYWKKNAVNSKVLSLELTVLANRRYSWRLFHR